MIDFVYQYNLFCILSALVVGVAVLFGLVLGYQIGKTKELREKGNRVVSNVYEAQSNGSMQGTRVLNRTFKTRKSAREYVQEVNVCGERRALNEEL